MFGLQPELYDRLCVPFRYWLNKGTGYIVRIPQEIRGVPSPDTASSDAPQKLGWQYLYRSLADSSMMFASRLEEVV